MILPAVRERLDAVLRQPAVDGALAALRAGANQVAFSGLHDVAKALFAAYATHARRRPAFFITSSNRRAEAFAETLSFSTSTEAGQVGQAGWPGRSQFCPRTPCLGNRKALTRIFWNAGQHLFRLADGQISGGGAYPRLCGVTTIHIFISLARTLSKD
jgi:hypothetical protein